MSVPRESTEARTQKPTQQESTIVERVARIVSNVRGAKSDYTSLAAELEPAIPFDIFGVVLLRHDRQAVRVAVCERVSNSWVAHYHQHPIKESHIEQLLSPVSVSSQDAAPLVNKSVDAELSIRVMDYLEGLDGPPARSGDALSGFHQLHSTLIAPLIVDGRLLGTLELGSIGLHTYRDETLQRLIAGVAQVLAAAIEGAQVGGSAEIQDRQRQALKDVSSALTSRVDLSTILYSIVDGIARSLNVASAIVMLDQRKGGLYLAAQSGLNAGILSKIVGRKTMLSEQTIIGATLRRRQPCVSQDIQVDERFPASRNFGLELGLRSIYCHPLATGTTVYGVLLLCSTDAGGFTPLKTDILSLFASQATIAIHNGKLLESAHQRSHFQETVEQLERTYQQGIARGQTSLQEEQELFKQVRETAEQTFGVSLSSLLRFISDHLLTRNERNLHHALLQAAEDGHEGELTADDAVFNDEKRAAPGGSINALANAALSLAPPQVQQWNETLEQALQSDAALPEKGIALLTRSAEEALARADVLSELSRLLTHLQQSTGHVQDAWFAIDLSGNCFSMNTAAESFCNMRLGISVTPSLQDIFAELMPRVRNSDEVAAYLQNFLASDLADNQSASCHCVLAVEPVSGRSRTQLQETLLADMFADLQIEDEDEFAPLLPELEDISLQLSSAPSDHHYQMKRYPLLNRDGQLAAYALQIHDITEQVRDEKNKSALLSSVSHDLRTPLTTIKAAVTGLMQDDVLWEAQVRQEILHEIDIETDHMTDLVDALVEMSRIEMGALSLEKEWCDVTEVMYGALARLERILADYTLKLDIPPQLSLIYADHVLLGKVFHRLLENAAYHSPPGAEIVVQLAAIESRSSPELAAVPTLEVRVIDQGSGIPETERERIFKSFYSLSPLGNGLGLAICKGIVEAHSGRIWVEPVAQGGSCFVITLPFSPYRSHSGEARSSQASHASPPASIAQPVFPEEPR